MILFFQKFLQKFWPFWEVICPQVQETKWLFSVKLEISIYLISSLADQGTLWTWPQTATCWPQCASLRTLEGNWWLIRKLWRSCQPIRILLWWWLLWASTAPANPTWWTSWLERTRVSSTSITLLSPFCPPTLPARSTVMHGEKVRDAEAYWKLSFNPQLCSYLRYGVKKAVHLSSHFALVSPFKSINCSFPRKTNNAVI